MKRWVLAVLLLVVFAAGCAAVLLVREPVPRPVPDPVIRVEPATDSPMCVPDAPDLVPPPPDCWTPDDGV